MSVEVHLSRGLPSFSMVGLAEGAVKESKDRVRSAILNSNFEFPRGRITVSLAPANLPKTGARYDLPIALGLLIASEQLSPVLEIQQLEFYAELALDGSLCAVDGLLPAVLATQQDQHIPVLSIEDVEQCGLCTDLNYYSASSLLEVCALLQSSNPPKRMQPLSRSNPSYALDLSQVKGQHQAKRALEIAAAGAHNLLLVGAPGSGKSMLAQRLPSIMPPLSVEQALDRASIYSIAQQRLLPDEQLLRAFRAPHHSASSAAMIGGGSTPKPGEISLAHHGVLFLDELAEFSRSVLEALRQPLETTQVCISRAAQQLSFPADFQLIGAMNPCPCGYYGDGSDKCHCSEDQVQRYQAKISGPLLERIDMVLHIMPVKKSALLDNQQMIESSDKVRKRVLGAYNRQLERQGKTNDKLDVSELEKIVVLSVNNKIWLAQVIEQLSLSARSYHRILKVARTIADLTASDTVEQQHLIEAASYRRLI